MVMNIKLIITQGAESQVGVMQIGGNSIRYIPV